MKRFISIVVVALTFCSVQFCQTPEEPGHLSTRALSKIADVVLRAEFKPREETTLIYIYGNSLKEASLPEIANTQFILIDNTELGRLGRAYLFKDPVFIKGKVRIDFGYGDNCGGSGGSYFFRVRGDRVTKTTDGGGWGSACSSGSGTSKKQ